MCYEKNNSENIFDVLRNKNNLEIVVHVIDVLRKNNPEVFATK